MNFFGKEFSMTFLVNNENLNYNTFGSNIFIFN